MDAAAKLAQAVAHWVDLQWSITVEHLRLVAPQAHGKLLDVGCGQKPYYDIFAPHVSEYVGIEHAPAFAETASSSEGARGPDIIYDGDRMPLGDDSFDTVLCVQVLEHTPKPQVLLNEIARVLRPGGLLIISVPFSFRLHEEPHDYFRYTPHGLRSMLEAAGLEVTSTLQQGGLWRVLGHKVNTFLAFRVGRLQGTAQRLGKLGHEKVAAKDIFPLRALLVSPWLPVVAGAARVLDRVAPDSTEMLSVFMTVTKVAKT
jgi:SAM-dependent methyltransferase